MKDKKSELTIMCVRWIFIIIGFLLIFVLGSRLLGDEHKLVLEWSIMLIAIGISFLPLTSIIFNKFHDGGWVFSKAIGVAVSGWLTWYLSSFFLSFTRRNCIIMLLVCALINYIAYAVFRYIIKKEAVTISFCVTEKKIFSAVSTELLFFLTLTIWCYLKGFRPEAFSTEKFMDYGFMLTIMKSDSMPPVDMWLSGNSINYYYVGQYLAVYMTKLTGTTVNYGYNISLMTVLSFSITLSYSLVYNITKNAGHNFAKRLSSKYLTRKKTYIDNAKISGFCTICGLLSACAVNITSNMHYPIYKFILAWLAKFSGKEYNYSYWFSNPTRYIGHAPETSDKTIHEFPSYSFVLGDLHAHVINIIFVLTLLGILYAFLLYRKAAMDDIRKQVSDVKVSFIRELFHPAVIMIGFFLGLFNTTNYWDFPIYFIVSGAVILFSNAVLYRFKKKTFTLTVLHAVVILTISQLVCLPFSLNFDSMPTGIALTESRTRLYQFAILWALPISCVLVFLIGHFLQLKNDKRIIFNKKGRLGKQKDTKNKKHIIADNEKNKNLHMNVIFQFIRELDISDLFIIIMGLCAIGLVLLPEIIYVVDIYTGHKRANTMFKLTYQAYIMFGLCMGYMIPKLIIFMKKKKYTILGSIMLICLIWSMGYIKQASDNWYGDVKDISRNKGLDAAAFLIEESREDYEAIKWLNENIEGLPVVLEANGSDFSYYQRVSVFTGLPTVLGWKDHEWLWRSGKGENPFAYPEEVAKRENDVREIYTSIDRGGVIELLKKYDVEYIYIGGCEREKFEELNEELLKSLGYVVFGNYQSADGTYIIKLDLGY